MLDNLRNYRIVLASQSPRRKELLAGLGLEYESRVLPDVDESFPPGLAGGDIPMYIAREKAEAYRPSLGADELLITADTIVWLGGSVLGKPYPIYRRPFPKCEEKWLVKDEYELAVQVNSRIKAKIVVPVDADNKQIQDIAVDAVKDVIGEQKVVKVIVIPKRLVNIVVK